MELYYDPHGLPRFEEIGKEAPGLAKKFFDYYNAVFAEGALTEREKSLNALAVAHAVQCPYCIDAYTQACLACIIHESLGFVNKHPQQIENLCCGFRQGASYPLKASPEWRPEKAVVEVPRQARDPEETRRAPWAECSWSQQGFMNNPG
jgi:alkylhydroperoxidase/carboxymuconolactone decarboxylase family protein